MHSCVIADVLSKIGSADEPEIEMLILLDRQVDCVTPLCTQLTYAGLVDEMFGIDHGRQCCLSFHSTYK